MKLARVPWIPVLVIGITLVVPGVVRAEVYGGIEIGAKGIRALAVEIAAPAEPRIVMLKNENTTLVGGLAANKQFSPKALEQTVAVVGRLAQKIRDDFKVPDSRLYIVGSSGLFAPLVGNAELIKASKEVLVQAIRKQTGLTMDFVSVKREAELTILSVVPTKDRAAAVLIDIGSGNTKGGSATSAGLVTFGIPFGTVSFADRVKQSAGGGSFVETADKQREQILMPKLRESLKGKAELVQRKRVYLAGGSVWALATFMKPADRTTLVALTPRDIAGFAKLLRDHADKLPDPDLSGASAERASRR